MVFEVFHRDYETWQSEREKYLADLKDSWLGVAPRHSKFFDTTESMPATSGNFQYKTSYRLHGLVLHHGATSRGGHYTTWSRAGGGPGLADTNINLSDNRIWFHFDFLDVGPKTGGIDSDEVFERTVLSREEIQKNVSMMVFVKEKTIRI